MLSVIVLGRNDSYGYNLHKRAAISLNCVAELLTEENDEILFVEYNAVDFLPTFPEAIADTLTEKARRLIRIIRVPGGVHDRLRCNSHLKIIEPIARNIALRRSNPDNPWVLSTNTDMIFVPRGANASLSAVAATREPGFYGVPRFELPEKLWESLDRLDPLGTMRTVARWGSDLRLNEAVLIHAFMLYDGPGDFQLARRADLFRIHGFNEQMLLGWHVDANLAKRMTLLQGPPRSLAGELFSYHCDHTRVETPMHAGDRVENDWSVFCDGVDSPFLPAQAETWGLPDEAFQEIRLDDSRPGYEAILKDMLEPLGDDMTQVVYTKGSYNNNLYYDVEHAFVFLADALTCLPRGTRIGYLGSNPSLVQKLVTFLERSGFAGQVLVSAECLTAASQGPIGAMTGQGFIRLARDVAELNDANLFVVDLGCHTLEAACNAEGFVAPRLTKAFLRFAFSIHSNMARLCEVEARRTLLGERPRRFLAMGVQNTSFEPYLKYVLNLVAVPYCCHVRFGSVAESSKYALNLKILEAVKAFCVDDESALDALVALHADLPGGEEFVVLDFGVVQRELFKYLHSVGSPTLTDTERWRRLIAINAYMAVVYGWVEDFILNHAKELALSA